jgi:hypothetical protein
MTRTADLLAAFGEQVRKNTRPDGTGASYEADGRVLRRLAEPGLDGSGILWSDLGADSADEVIAAQVALFAARGQRFEWKLYSYDEPVDLAERLRGAGFVADEPESLMITEVSEVLARLGDTDVPAGVRLAEVTTVLAPDGPQSPAAGLDQLIGVHEQVFGKDESARRAELLAQLTAAPERVGLVIALASAGGSGGSSPRASTEEPVAAARIEFVPGAQFAGLWGGGTLVAWRGRGIYRALVRHRAELAAARGYRYLTVDASDQSRPILERVGFECVATTTPYVWSPGK